jgi:hypothetical protein
MRRGPPLGGTGLFVWDRSGVLQDAAAPEELHFDEGIVAGAEG